MEVVGADGDISMVGQSGVGFHFDWLAFDKTHVVSKSDGRPYTWKSAADGQIILGLW